MANVPLSSLEPNEIKSKVTLRRLILAKEMFLHGVDYLAKGNPLSKMIAIQNIHNAVEIVLKAIFLHFDIRPEKELNIGFENMFNEIDRHPFFKEQDIKLPYRQEMRNLNQQRNLVQHHATEPEISTIEDIKVFVNRFLEQTYFTYWGCDFNSISQIEMISDSKLKEILTQSLSAIREKKYKRSLTLTEVAFYWASQAILSFLPIQQSNSLFPFPDLQNFSRKIMKTLVDLNSQINNDGSTFRFRTDLVMTGDSFRELDQFAFDLNSSINSAKNSAIYYSGLFSTGINLVDFKRFKNCTPTSYFSTHSEYKSKEKTYKVDVHWRNYTPTEQEAVWAHNFVVSTLIHWQILGLNPAINNEGDIPEFYKIILNWDEEWSPE